MRMSMLDSRQDQRSNKMCDDIHDIDRKLMYINKQLTRIADALERAYPKPKISTMRSEIVDEANNV